MRRIEFEHIPERRIPDKPLGRTVLHDSRSKEYRVAKVDTPQSVAWQRMIPILNQSIPKPLGSCTGNATVGVLGTEPFYSLFREAIETSKLVLDEDLAIELYKTATRLDPFAGTYPPTDTGSNGLSVAKAAMKFKLIPGYEHAIGIDDFISGMQKRPGIVGTRWRTGCDSPDAQGIVRYTGEIRGGHEYEAAELDLNSGLVWFWNSWGPGWGVRGKFAMPLEDFEKALDEDGDATFFTPPNQPAPTPTPNPTPANTTDQNLVAAMDPWAENVWSQTTRAGKAKQGYETWKVSKGL